MFLDGDIREAFLPVWDMDLRGKKMREGRNNIIKYYTVDVLHVATRLRKWAWVILTVGVLAAAVGFYTSEFYIAPKYTSEVKLYVDNVSRPVDEDGFSINIADLKVAKELVKTYGVILKSRSTLELVSERSNTGYSWTQIRGMISYEASEDAETMNIKVVCGKAGVSKEIADAIADIFPKRVSKIVENSSMVVVDYASVTEKTVLPNVYLYVIGSFILGILGTSVIICIFTLLSNTVYDEEYILLVYEYPVLGKVPNLLDKDKERYYRKE